MSRNRPIRHALAAAMFLCAGVLVAYAQDDVIERQLKAAPGRDVRAGVFTDIHPDCTSGRCRRSAATPPAHGSGTVKRGTLRATNIKQCLAIEVPAFVAFYRAARTTAAPMILNWKSVRRMVTSGANASM